MILKCLCFLRVIKNKIKITNINQTNNDMKFKQKSI